MQPRSVWPLSAFVGGIVAALGCPHCQAVLAGADVAVDGLVLTCVTPPVAACWADSCGLADDEGAPFAAPVDAAALPVFGAGSAVTVSLPAGVATGAFVPGERVTANVAAPAATRTASTPPAQMLRRTRPDRPGGRGFPWPPGTPVFGPGTGADHAVAVFSPPAGGASPGGASRGAETASPGVSAGMFDVVPAGTDAGTIVSSRAGASTTRQPLVAVAIRGEFSPSAPRSADSTSAAEGRRAGSLFRQAAVSRQAAAGGL